MTVWYRQRKVCHKIHGWCGFQECCCHLLWFSCKQRSYNAAGENAVKLVYDADNASTTLNKLRCQKFHLKVATSSTYVQSKSLPPTAASCYEHSLRVYLQVQEWKHTSCLNPEEYGWKLQNNKYVPVFFKGIKPAPDQLLRIIRCTCKGDCSKVNCSCKFNGLECTSACKECRGSTCSNSKHIEEIDDDEPDEDTGIDGPSLWGMRPTHWISKRNRRRNQEISFVWSRSRSRNYIKESGVGAGVVKIGATPDSGYSI